MDKKYTEDNMEEKKNDIIQTDFLPIMWKNQIYVVP